jgi:hypothetical protein
VFAFPAVLSCHTIGMGLVAGINAALALRILGVGRGIPLREMERFFPVMWAGFWLNAVSGVALFIGYPTKAMTNPVFYLKLTLIAVGLWLLHVIRGHVFGDVMPEEHAKTGHVKMLAVASLGCWAAVITAGRLLAYTYTRLMAN